MEIALIKTYIVNFAYLVLRAAVYALACFLAWRIFDRIEKIDLRLEISENKNVGIAIMVAAIFLGLAYVIGQI